MPWPVMLLLLKDWKETSVGASTMICALWSAMKAMKRPMPTLTALFKGSGMQLKMLSRTLVSERARKISPSTKTARSANCQE